jgi:hypothetical protein
MGGTRNAYRILVGKSERKRQRGGSERRWKNNIRTNLRERRWEVMDWMHLAQDKDQWQALVNTVIKLKFHKRREIS